MVAALIKTGCEAGTESSTLQSVDIMRKGSCENEAGHSGQGLHTIRLSIASRILVIPGSKVSVGCHYKGGGHLVDNVITNYCRVMT